jgi:hypothetical protein
MQLEFKLSSRVFFFNTLVNSSLSIWLFVINQQACKHDHLELNNFGLMLVHQFKELVNAKSVENGQTRSNYQDPS